MKAKRPQSDNIETVDICTVSDDQQCLDYAMVVADQATFIEPATVIKTYWLALGESLAEPTYCTE